VPASKKPAVFEHLFRWRYDVDGNRSERWDAATGTIPEDRRLVYSDEVVRSIRDLKIALGNNQAANFSKDFLRKPSRSANWPESLAKVRWTMKQQTGKDTTTIPTRARNFVFRPYAETQTEPFPDEWPVPDDPETHAIQSVTISVASKQIERLDETRLMQIVVDLRIVETHFALYSPLSTDDFKIVHMDHLQMGLKLRGSEVDGLYLAEFMDRDRGLHPVLITVEAKKHDEFINSSQLVGQVQQVSGLGVVCEMIVPIALKHADGGVILFEFKPFKPPEGGKFSEDDIDEDDVKDPIIVRYSVEPTIVGLSRKASRPKTAKTGADAKITFVESEVDPELIGDQEDEDEDE
jgi:hypothetical protein